MTIYYDSILKELHRLDIYSKEHTTCLKTYVGASVGNIYGGVYFPSSTGCNRNTDYNCLIKGCYRRIKFGSDSKHFRQFCKAIHAEDNALRKLFKNESVKVAVVTRYPCEHCAQLLVDAGVKIVFYGRPFKISETTEKLFDDNDVQVIHVEEWTGDKNDSNR